MFKKRIDKNEKFIKRWEKARKRGRIKNAVFEGLIIVLCALIGIIIKHLFFKATSDIASDLIGYCTGFFVGRFFGSYNNWDKNEQKYNELINKISLE